jgi:hypothetical protein
LEQAGFHRAKAHRARRLTRSIDDPQALLMLAKLADEMERLANNLSRQATRSANGAGRTQRLARSAAPGLTPHVAIASVHSVLRIVRRRPQRGDRCDDAEPSVGSLFVALAAHPFDHFASLRERFISVLLNPAMSGSGDVEIGDLACRRLRWRSEKLQPRLGRSNRMRSEVASTASSKVQQGHCRLVHTKSMRPERCDRGALA